MVVVSKFKIEWLEDFQLFFTPSILLTYLSITAHMHIVAFRSTRANNNSLQKLGETTTSERACLIQAAGAGQGGGLLTTTHI